MLGFLFVSISALCYLGLLFAVAWFGDRHAARLRQSASQPLVYALSLAVFCTAWSFYGSVGRASVAGLDFAFLCAGPLLMMVLGYPLIRKMIHTAQANNCTSVADFIGARYGKSQPVAALATVIAVVGVLPYIALQLQAVSISFNTLATGEPGPLWSAYSVPPYKDTALYVAVIMSLFAILFGVRHVHSSERHQGMMVAIAFESLIKLFAILAIGIFVTFVLFSGPGHIAQGVDAHPWYGRFIDRVRPHPSWISITLLAGLAFICLPRQFHVAVVESGRPSNLRTAVWVFPLYILAITLFVPAIGAAGRVTLDNATLPALYVLTLPMSADQPVLSLIVFLGGLSAATAMIIVEVVALSTMVCNEIVMPLLLRRSSLRDAHGEGLSRLLLRIRRTAVFAILITAYAYHAKTADRYPLSSIGIISFAAVAQFAPALIAGLYWRKAHRLGAYAGMLGGALIWTYDMFLPSLLKGGWLSARSAFMPDSLPLLTPGIDPLTNSMVLSLGLNTLLLVVVSLLAHSNERDKLQADIFVTGPKPSDASRIESPDRAPSFEPLKTLAARLVGPDLACRAFSGPVETYRDKDLAAYTERLLSGAIGSASAHIMVTAVLQSQRTHTSATRTILDEASEAILFNHDLLRATLENVTQGIGMFDSQRNLAAWNRRFLQLLCIPEERAQIGHPLHGVLVGKPSVGRELDRLLASSSSPHALAVAHTLQQKMDDGRTLEFQINPIQAGGFVLVCTDITEEIRTLEALRNSERRVRDANERLEMRVTERTRELTLLNEKLAEAKRAAEAASVGKTRFLAAASHDLLQPLHVARLLTGALSEGRRAGNSMALLNQLDQALGSVDELLQTLLDISKLDAGAVRPQLRSVGLHSLLTGVAASFQPIAAQRGLELRVFASRAMVLTDPVLFRRILQNFLSNALRYTPRGKVLIGCRRRGGRIVVEVWDSGIGIPQDQLHLIFEEFKRGVSDDPQTPPGLGLGLAIVDRISHMLEHPVSVRSWPGRGSVFSVAVPLGSAVPDAPLPPKENRLTGSLANKLVLCVDNDPAALVAIRTLLQGWSCKVLTALDVPAACREIDARGKVPDIVLMDYHLDNGVTGLDALEALAAHTGERATAILITANHTEAVRDAAGTLGYPMLNKPVRPGALRALMTQMLSQDAQTRTHIPA